MKRINVARWKFRDRTYLGPKLCAGYSWRANKPYRGSKYR